MTSRADEIQQLIADIDNLLTNSGKRLSRLLSGQAQEPKEVLERLRDFLVRMDESETVEAQVKSQPSGQPMSPLLARFVEQGNNQPTSQSDPTSQEEKAVEVEQFKSEFSALLQPLQAELSALIQERTTLVQEIRQLEQKRLQNYSLTQQLANQEQMIGEFLQVLMSRLVPSLTPHLTADAASFTPNSDNTNLESTSATTLPVLEAPEQIERLASLARELDQRLISLDGTVNVVFEGLQRNINTYHQSLSQAIARMHSQGMQGEQLMASFLQNLTQYLPPQSSLPQLSFPETENTTLPLNLSLADPVTVQPATTNSETESATLPLNLSLADSVAVQPATTNSETESATLPLNLSLADPVTVQPADTLESLQFDTTPDVEDLDAVLSQLVMDEPPFSEPASSIDSKPEVSRLIGDEVDQLYASLFGSTDSISPSAELTPQVETKDLSPLASMTNLEVQAEAPVALPEAWFNQADAGLLALGNAPSSAIPDPAMQLVDSSADSWEVLFTDEPLPQAEVVPQESLLGEVGYQPDTIDTITVLTDLLVDVDHHQGLLAVSSTVNHPETTVPELPIVNEERERHFDNYIPASPQENLLSLEDTQIAAIPDIVLDEEQLRQLDRDLANFDQRTHNFDSFADLVSQSQGSLSQVSPGEELTSNYGIENASTGAFLELEVPQGETEVDFSPQTEKKKEVTNLGPEGLLFSIEKLNNDSAVALPSSDEVWYLGLDLGTTGISAALLNRSSCVVYPIYWSAETQPGVTSFQQSFRLPAEVYLPTASVPHSEMENSEAMAQTIPTVVTQEQGGENLTGVSDSTQNLYSAKLKPYLQVVIPYKNSQQKWEPVLQLNEFSAGPLIWVVRSLSKLLLTLTSKQGSTTPALIAAAVGMDAHSFSDTIHQIAGVICTCPSTWSEQYRFNVREAVLASKLVSHPQQVFFVEEAIASLLPELDAGNGESVQLSDLQGLRLLKTNEHQLVGNTLTINIGATATEMSLVDLPSNLEKLTHNDFMLHGFAYAGKGIEQDIICQLLLPPKSRQSRLDHPADTSTTNTNPWHWQPAIPGLDQMQWQSLRLEELELPRVGEPDVIARIRLQQRLEGSVLGQAVLDAALALKLILQHQESFTLELADQRWVLQRRDLESQVFVPFVRRLNRELNKLLVARGIPTEAINQAILSGGVTAVGTVNRWLRQKLPNAKIIQDLYLGENGAPNCSRVAHGLALLPLHPQVLEVPRQQYTDYFLFTELLRLLPERSLSFSEILQLFESQGINTRNCQQRLLAFLEGELPSGLIPSVIESTWLTQQSLANSEYKVIASTPLFEKQGSLSYRPNSSQLLILRQYLDAIKASTLQSLEEPYTVNFALETHN